MQDKTFQQAIQDLQGKMMNGMQDTVCRMIEHRTTVTHASSEIQDEKIRAFVQRTLLIGQMITLLGMMKDMQIINECQYKEFTAYLMNSSAQ